MGRRSYSPVNTDAPLGVDSLHNSLAAADYYKSSRSTLLLCKSGRVPLAGLQATLMTPRVRRFSAYVHIHENHYNNKAYGISDGHSMDPRGMRITSDHQLIADWPVQLVAVEWACATKVHPLVLEIKMKLRSDLHAHRTPRGD